MRRWKSKVGAGLMLGMIALALLGWLREREPTYNGRSLSYWVMLLGKVPQNEVERESTAAAIRHIGTNGFPLLIRWLAYDEVRDQTRLGLLSRIKSVSAFHGKHVILPRRKLAVGAREALICMDAGARPAFPELRRLLNEGAPGAQARALRVLTQLRAVHLLVEAAENKKCLVRAQIIRQFGELFWSDPAAVAALRRIAADPEDALREEAAIALLKLPGDAVQRDNRTASSCIGHRI